MLGSEWQSCLQRVLTGSALINVLFVYKILNCLSPNWFHTETGSKLFGYFGQICDSFFKLIFILLLNSTQAIQMWTQRKLNFTHFWSGANAVIVLWLSSEGVNKLQNDIDQLCELICAHQHLYCTTNALYVFCWNETLSYIYLQCGSASLKQLHQSRFFFFF